MTAAAITSIVIVSHDSGALLQRCIQAVLAQNVALELIVVDNASRDHSLETLAPGPNLRLIRNSSNRGFSVACNQGAKTARGAYLLFLNPDCLLPTDAVRYLRMLAESDPAFAILGARLLNADGTPQAAARRHTPTPMRALRRVLGWRGESVEMTDKPAVVPSALPPLEAVDAVSGALMLLPRAVFQQLGGFDEGYRLHCEDLDLCRRALLAGYKVGVARDLAVTHLKGTSSRRRPIWVEWHKHRGMLRYFRKFDAATSPWWLRMAVPLGVWGHFPFAAWRAWRRAAIQDIS